jgi:hypothetical protein
LLQGDFDKTLKDILGKSYHFSGVTLLLGSLLERMKIGDPRNSPTTIAPLYLQGAFSGEFSGIVEIYPKKCMIFDDWRLEFLNYFAELLENPERSKSHVFDHERYATASKECLQLRLCNHLKTSKRDMRILDQLPSFLAISLELAEFLRRRTFTKMGQKFPRRVSWPRMRWRSIFYGSSLGWANGEVSRGGTEVDVCK